jgi:hypothetical protein
MFGIGVFAGSWQSMDVWAALGTPWVFIFDVQANASHSLGACLKILLPNGGLSPNVVFELCIGYLSLAVVVLATQQVNVVEEGKTISRRMFTIGTVAGLVALAYLGLNLYVLPECMNEPQGHHVITYLKIYLTLVWASYSVIVLAVFGWQLVRARANRTH